MLETLGCSKTQACRRSQLRFYTYRSKFSEDKSHKKSVNIFTIQAAVLPSNTALAAILTTFCNILGHVVQEEFISTRKERSWHISNRQLGVKSQSSLTLVTPQEVPHDNNMTTSGVRTNPNIGMSSVERKTSHHHCSVFFTFTCCLFSLKSFNLAIWVCLIQILTTSSRT